MWIKHYFSNVNPSEAVGNVLIHNFAQSQFASPSIWKPNTTFAEPACLRAWRRIDSSAAQSQRRWYFGTGQASIFINLSRVHASECLGKMPWKLMHQPDELTFSHPKHAKSRHYTTPRMQNPDITQPRGCTIKTLHYPEDGKIQTLHNPG